MAALFRHRKIKFKNSISAQISIAIVSGATHTARHGTERKKRIHLMTILYTGLTKPMEELLTKSAPKLRRY